MRLSKILKYIVLMAFCMMYISSLYIFLDFLPELEGSQMIGLSLQRSQAFPKSTIVPMGSTHNVSKETTEVIIKERQNRMKMPENIYVNSDYVANNTRFFIYRCDMGKMGNCYNWFDIFKGMETSYLIANLTGRIFKAQIHDLPCQLEHFMLSQNVNWSLSSTVHQVLNKGMAGIGLRLMDNNYPFYNNLHTMNFSEFAQDNFDYIYFKSNLDYISGFQKSSVYPNQLSWMSGVRQDRIHSFLFQRLFRLAARLQKKLDIYLYSIVPSSQHRLLCVDLTQDNHLPYDNFKHQQLSIIWSFLKIHSQTNIHKIFLLTDSPETLAKAKRESFKDRIVESPMFNLRTADPLKHACNHLESQIFHQHLMINCDVLVVNRYGIGRLAAYLRGTDNGLYCLLDHGHIHPCAADSFQNVFQTRT